MSILVSDILLKPKGGPVKFAYASGSRPLEGYTIKRGIGVGGFGEVYFAKSDGGKEVALKHIQRNLDVELRGVSQCLNLKHLNLVALYDIRFDSAEEAWVVMEYVAGENLRTVIDAHPNGMSEDQVRHWFAGIASGTIYLHDHGIVHRDLKPGNIFSDDGIIKIGDYGLSKFISVSRRSGQTESVGTFHYMAPEIGKGVYGKGIDIYALGIVLYEMLTGRVPFDGESSQEIIMKHLTAFPDLEVLSSGYRNVIGKALAKDPEQRYSDVTAILRDLEFESPFPVIRNRLTSDLASAKSQEAHSVNHDVDDDVRSVTNVVSDLLEIDDPPDVVVTLPSRAFEGNRSASSEIQSKSTMLPAKPSRKRRVTYRSWQELAREELGSKSFRQQLMELSGSMLMNVLVCAVLGVVMIVVDNQEVSRPLTSWLSRYAWLTLTCIATSWAVLIPAKFWEGSSGEPSLRRFVMLVVGLINGVVIFSITELLMQRPTYLIAGHTQHFSEKFYALDGSPHLLAFLGYFAGLFVVLRLWRQVDPLRYSRVSVWAVTVVVLWALVLHAFLPFPNGVLIASVVSIAIQLSASWMSRAERGQFRREARGV